MGTVVSGARTVLAVARGIEEVPPGASVLVLLLPNLCSALGAPEFPWKLCPGSKAFPGEAAWALGALVLL